MDNLQHRSEFERYLSGLKRRKGLFALIFSAVALIAVLMALFLPAFYQSTAVILIERQEIPEDLVRSTVTTYADQSVQVINQRVMTSENLKGIIDKYQLYQAERKSEPLEVILEVMRERIIVEMISADVVDPRSGRPTQATIAFSISFEHKNPSLAQNVANELVTLYLNENVKTRTESASESSDFLAAEADRLRDNVVVLESKLADFKEKNVDRLPELSEFNRRVLDRTENDLIEVNRNISALRERQIYLAAQLSNTNPFDAVYGESGQRIFSPSDKVKELTTGLLSLEARYGKEHPDVLAARKELEAMRIEAQADGKGDLRKRLESMKTKLISLKERYSDNHPDVMKQMREIQTVQNELSKRSQTDDGLMSRDQDADNPAYIQIKAQLEAARTELSTFRQKKNQLETKMLELEKRISMAPGVEREYRLLYRDYENSTAKYREVAAKQMEAELSQKLESERKGEKFTLIEPPTIPETPSRPNRLAILIVGIFLALLLGFGASGIAQALDNHVHGRQGIMNVIGVAPIGVIPIIPDSTSQLGFGQRNVFLFGGLLTILVIVALLLHILVMPLDVLFFVALRKLGF